MPRRARVEVEGGVYHVHNRVANGEAVFGDPEEARRFVEVIREVKRRGGRACRRWPPDWRRSASRRRAAVVGSGR